MADTDRFVVDISRMVDRIRGDLDAQVRGIALGALAVLQENTPVEHGRLRASWQLIPPVDEIRAGTTVEIVTNVEYAHRIDQGFVGTDSLGRHYNQQGVHMVAKTIAELPAIAEKVKEDLR